MAASRTWGENFTFKSSDGTPIVGWRNGAAGVPVVISNGLGTPPEAWPALAGKGCGFAAVTFSYRGTGGSARPADRRRIRVEDHVSDLVALMDHERVERALVASWSIGVNLAFELARRHPERVAGMLVVAGLPGGSFGSMFAPLFVPRFLRRRVASGVTGTARAVGGALSAIASRLPMNDLVARLVSHSGFMLPQARPEVLKQALGPFFQNDFRWYFKLAQAAGEHRPFDPSFLRCPTTVVAGRWDMLTAFADVKALAPRIPGARLVTLPGSHFLPLEYPERMGDELAALAARCDLAAASPAGR